MLAEGETMSRGNFTQRVFDILHARGWATIDEIAFATGLTEDSVRIAFKSLRKVRALASQCRDRIWYWGLREGAERPSDRRGGFKGRSAA